MTITISTISYASIVIPMSTDTSTRPGVEFIFRAEESQEMIAWFQSEFGFSEEAVLAGGFDAVRDKFKCEKQKDGQIILESKDNQQQFRVGRFEVPSLKTLREELRKCDVATTPGQISYVNIVGDARQLHLDPNNADAVFQMASQFNCLEMIEPAEKPEHGITQYCYDRTQGPVCAMACPAATVFRNYFAPVGFLQAGSAEEEWTGQAGGSDKQLDTTIEVATLLDNNSNQYWTMKNGYLLPRRGAMREVATCMESLGDPDAVSSLMRVGVHWSTQTARFRVPGSPRSPKGRLPQAGEREAAPHSVCQVLCSAVPVAYDKITPADEWQPFACAVLDAQYQATLAVAAILSLRRKQRVKVFLTSVGGGAFGNKIEWVVGAVEKAMDRFKMVDIDVKVVHYGKVDTSFAGLEQRYSPPAGAAQGMA